MGYTHYWYIPLSAYTARSKSGNPALESQAWARFVRDCRRYIALAKERGIRLQGWEAGTEPVADDDAVVVGSPDGEPFVLLRERLLSALLLKSHVFQFCKTNRGDYDLVVCLCLLSLHDRFSQIRFKTDGGPDDWQEAMQEFERMKGDEEVVHCS